MLKYALFFAALVGVLSIPVRLRQRFSFSDATVTEMFTASNPKYSGSLYVTSTTGQLSVIVDKGTPQTLLNLQSQTASPPTSGGIIGGVAVHPTMDQIYVSYTRDPTPTETTMYRIMDGATARDPKYIGQVSRWEILSTGALANEKRILSSPAYDNAENPIPELAFDKEGLLYIGVANTLWRAGGLKDPNMLADGSDNFFGKILRIDPNNQDKDTSLNYKIPESNVGRNIAGAKGEIYASGFSSPHDFSWSEDGSLLVLDSNDSPFDDELNMVKGGNFGFPTVVGKGVCYAKPNCKSVGTPAAVSMKYDAFGTAMLNGRILVASKDAIYWYSQNSDVQDSIRLLDADGYSQLERFPNFVFTDLIRQKANGTVYVMGSGESQKTIIFSVVEDFKSAASVSRPAAMLLAICAVVMMVL